MAPKSHGIDHSGANAKQHGYVAMHLDDSANKGGAKGAVDGLKNTIQAREQVKLHAVHDVDDLLVQYVEDTAGRSMDQFHNSLGAISAQYWALAQNSTGASTTAPPPPLYFTWVHWF